MTSIQNTFIQLLCILGTPNETFMDKYGMFIYVGCGGIFVLITAIACFFVIKKRMSSKKMNDASGNSEFSCILLISINCIILIQLVIPKINSKSFIKCYMFY